MNHKIQRAVTVEGKSERGGVTNDTVYAGNLLKVTIGGLTYLSQKKTSPGRDEGRAGEKLASMKEGGRAISGTEASRKQREDNTLGKNEARVGGTSA